MSTAQRLSISPEFLIKLLDILRKLQETTKQQRKLNQLCGDLKALLGASEVWVLKKSWIRTQVIGNAEGLTINHESLIFPYLKTAAEETEKINEPLRNAEETDSHLRGLKRYCEANTVMSLPLGNTLGHSSCLVLTWKQTPPEAHREHLNLVYYHLKDALSNMIQSNNWLTINQQLTHWLTLKRKEVLIYSGVALAILLIPIPYQVSAKVSLSAPERRLVSTPFKAQLAESLVDPGDKVVAGQIIARLDDDELKSQTSELESKINQFSKDKDSALAEKNPAQYKLAELEVEKLQIQLANINSKLTSIAIKSPIDGVITQEHVKVHQGSTLNIGEPLFEVASLEHLNAEYEVAEEDIRLIKPEAKGTIKLASYTGKSYKTIAERIWPHAEVRHYHNVFIVESSIIGSVERIMPGMEGRGKLNAGWRPLIWIWLRKPWAWVKLNLLF